MLLLIQLLLAFVFVYLAFNVAYVSLFCLGGLLVKQPSANSNQLKHRFLLVYAAYKEDAVILESLKNCQLNYPRELYQVLVAADALKVETLAEIKHLGFDYVEVKLAQRTKAKALHYTLERFATAEFDFIVVMDIDNHPHPDFLAKMNAHLLPGVLFVQGHRVAKNLDTDYAILDAVSEEINNHIFRKGQVALGLSCSIIGSAFAMQTKAFCAIISEVNAVGGFDKEMEVLLLQFNPAKPEHPVFSSLSKETLQFLTKRRIKMEYAPDALVFDEKVQDGEIFENQRKRWVSAQLVYLKKYLPDAFGALIKTGNLDYFNKIIQFTLLPRVMLLGLTTVLAFSAWLAPVIFKRPEYWFQLPIILLITLVLATPKELRNFRSMKALRLIPGVVFRLFRIVFRLKGANKSFIHTPHKTKQ